MPAKRPVTLFWNTREQRLRAFWRVLLTVVVVTGAVQAARLALHGTVGMPAVPYLEAAAVVVVTLALGVVAARVVDRRPLRSYGFSTNRQWWADLGAGALIGLAIGAIAFVTLLAAGWAHVTAVFSPGASGHFWSLVPGLVLHAASVALWEELVFRGSFLRNTAEGVAGPLSPRAAVVTGWLVSSVVFALLHANQFVLGPVAATAVVMWLAMALLLGLTYVCTGSLALALGLHLTVNPALQWVFGLQGTLGAAAPAVVRLELTGPEAMVGLAGGVQLAAVGAGWLLVLAWLRRRPGGLTLHRGLAQPPRVAPAGDPRPTAAGVRRAEAEPVAGGPRDGAEATAERHQDEPEPAGGRLR